MSRLCSSTGVSPIADRRRKSHDVCRAVREAARELQTHLPCLLHAPEISVKSLLGISTDSESTDWRARWGDFRQPCGHVCKRTRQEGGRRSGHARGRVRQRRAAQMDECIISSRRALQGGQERAHGTGGSTVPTAGGREVSHSSSLSKLVQRERPPGLDEDTASAQGWACCRHERCAGASRRPKCHAGGMRGWNPTDWPADFAMFAAIWKYQRSRARRDARSIATMGRDATSSGGRSCSCPQVDSTSTISTPQPHSIPILAG